MACTRSARTVAVLVAFAIGGWLPQAAAGSVSSPATAASSRENDAESQPAETADGASSSVAAGGTVPDRGAVLVEVGPPPEPVPAPREPEVAASPPPPLVSDRPEEPRIGGKPATGKGLLIAGAATFAVGAIGLVTASLITLNCRYDGPLHCRYEDQADFLVPLTATPVVLGLVLLGVGTGYHARYRRWQRWKPESDRATAVLTPAITRDGGALVVQGRF